MRHRIGLLAGLLLGGSIVFLSVVDIFSQSARQDSRQTMVAAEDFHRAMKELSNWGRWGTDDELGAANLITPAKRKQALALAREGITVSLAHDIIQAAAPDGAVYLDRAVLNVSPTGASDRYQYTGTYHGSIHSHLDALDCHVMYEGKGYNGVPMEDVKASGGCPKGHINVHKSGIVTRAVLFDATLLPGKATPQGWLEPGTAIHREDLEALEKIERVKVAPGDVILLYTGRWKRRTALGPWKSAEGWAGYHADVAYFLKERDVAFIGGDAINDVSPSGLPTTVPGTPLHRLARGAGGQHLRQPRLRSCCPNGKEVEAVRVSVCRGTPSNRQGNGLTAESDRDLLVVQHQSTLAEACPERRSSFDQACAERRSPFDRLRMSGVEALRMTGVEGPMAGSQMTKLRRDPSRTR